ncbi:MAG: iron complex outermembrane receptor protein [Halioglobus sp.]|jgi:outer membrane receptor protein involved in Fe transport
MIKNKLSHAVHVALGVGFASAMPFASVVNAQEDIIEEVVITGSRISRPDLEAVSPYITVGAEEFTLSGNFNVEQKLAELPLTLPSFGASSNNPGDGTARVDLRGLDTVRTLVLVNGRRYIPATQTGVVDLNSIPATLIKQVDVLTGGASAVYGSDALAGVVNFQLVDDFEGVKITGVYDITEEGDAEKYNMDITMGGNFDDGRGNAVIYASYSKREALFQGDRSFSSLSLSEGTNAAGNNALIPAGSSGVPGTRTFSSYALPNGDTLGTFNQDGSGRAWDNVADRFNYAPDNFLQLPQERYLISALSHYDINEKATVYGEFAFSHNKVPQELAPTPAFTSVFVNPESAFFGDDVKEALRGQQTSDTNGDGLIDDNDNVYMYIGRRMVENGSRQSIDTRDGFRILLGVRGDINDNWSYDAYYSFADLERSTQLNNDVSNSKFQQAIAVTDDATACQDPSGGCVPLNIFGAGNITQEAVDFINIGATNITSIEQEVIQLSVTGEVFTLPFSNSAVAVVLGYERREDFSNFRPDTFLASGDVLGFNAGLPTSGGFDVQEFFGEVSVPLLQDKTGIRDLTFWAAARVSDYSNIKSDVTSWASALNYAPTDTLNFRVGYQEAIRAPNVDELFGGSANGFPAATDPCSADGFQAGITSAALCEATGVAPGQVGQFAQANAQIEGTFGGNPDLTEETSETFTIGVVWQPTDNFDVSLDYYEIEIEDAIDVLGGGLGNTLAICYNTVQDLNSEFCNTIQRRPDGNVNNVSILNANIGIIETSGVDLNAHYSTDFGWGIGGHGSTLNLGFSATFLDKYDTTPVAVLPNDVNECAGAYGATCFAPRPEVLWNLRSTLYTGDWTFTALLRFIDETEDDQIALGTAVKSDFAEPEIGAEYYLDIGGAYQFSDGFSINVGVSNVLDTEPNQIGDASNSQGNTWPEAYPLFGPRFFASFSYEL